MTSTSDAPTRQAALCAAIDTVGRNIAAFGGNYPDDTTTNNRYELRPATADFALGQNRGWTTSFWSGMQWLAWENTGTEAFRAAAEAHADDFVRRVNAGEDLDTHDLGFLYSLACVTTARLGSGDAVRERSRQAALLAANLLMKRFLEPAGIIQAWGDLSDPVQRGRTIIDSLMNMPLLTWAHKETGEERFADAVRRHTTQLRKNIIRDDDTTFHTFYWDPETGEPLRGGTEQGAFDESCWARGQAWGIYGFALNHRETGDPELLAASWRCAEYFLSHLPSDGVPYWDMVYTDGADAPRDSSAAAIAASGLIELAGVEPDPAKAAKARAAAEALVDALAAGYVPEPGTSDAQLLHSVYDAPKNIGVDEGSLWGDYFYLEALTRLNKPEWVTYW
jgi:unsaturated chondroitin disaccharide hydrolase